MAIVENKASEIGDIILIKASVPIIGLVTLSSFTDSTVNETASKFFTKEFRYSIDAINYSAWIPLTNANISSITIEPTDTFLIEYRYIRSGVDTSTPDLEFNQVQISGDFEAIPCGDVYNDSIFAKFFTCTDICVLNWMINVLEKIYEDGILPKYITRGLEGNDARQDQDFIEFWKTIAQYFAYIVCYARQWEISNATANYDILIAYLRNQNLIFCGNEPIQDLLYVMNNTYDEFRKRGTLEIFKTKDDDGRPVDGEFHRLFCNLRSCTDWYLSNVSNFKIGWVGDQASPLYQGNYFDINLIKAYEEGESVLDLNNYPLVGPTSISIQTDTDNAGNSVDVMQIDDVTAGFPAGIGHVNPQEPVDELLPVSTKLDYEITFWVKMVDLNDVFTFGVSSYDESGNLIPAMATKRSFLQTDSSLFLEKQQFLKNDTYYFVRGIIYNINHNVLPGEVEEDYYLLSNSNSSHLTFNNESICYISPYIVLDNVAEPLDSGSINLYDVKVRPLRTCYSTGFEQVSNFVKIGVENFNQNLSNIEIESILREFLLPYNTTFNVSYLNPCGTVNVDNASDIITEDDVRWSSPAISNVDDGDRYLVWDGSVFKLYQYNSGLNQWDLSSDNIQGSKVFVVEKKVVFLFDSGNWLFSCK